MRLLRHLISGDTLLDRLSLTLILMCIHTIVHSTYSLMKSNLHTLFSVGGTANCT